MAAEILLPTGQFEYKNSEVTHLRDVRVFSIAEDVGVETYEDLKRRGYICREIPVLMIRCYKFQEDIGSVEIPLQEVLDLAPFFGENYKVKVLSRSNYLLLLGVTQTVSTPYGSVIGYEIHMKENDDQFMEINFHNEPFYYQYSEEDLEVVFLRRTYRKRTGDNRYSEYGVRSTYVKKN